MRRSAFTLIEALSVIAIIGILATMTIYVVGNALSRGRDARRKSDLTAISLGFQARYDALTCSNPIDVAYYPGRNLNPSARWKKVSDLAGLNNDCGSFSEVLATIPQNPNDRNNDFPYRFDLSHEGSVVGKHYRLDAHLEKALTSQEQSDLDRMSNVWIGSFGGADLTLGYNYMIGK